MNFQLLGVNHKTASVEVREQLAIPERRLPDALRDLMQVPGVGEGMILSTCNRVEVLAQTANGSTDLRQFFRQHFSLDASLYEPHLYEYRQNDAVRHVFRVPHTRQIRHIFAPVQLKQFPADSGNSRVTEP